MTWGWNLWYLLFGFVLPVPQKYIILTGSNYKLKSAEELTEAGKFVRSTLPLITTLEHKQPWLSLQLKPLWKHTITTTCALCFHLVNLFPQELVVFTISECCQAHTLAPNEQGSLLCPSITHTHLTQLSFLAIWSEMDILSDSLLLESFRGSKLIAEE